MEAGHPRINDGITERAVDVLQSLPKNLKLLWELPVPEKCCGLPLRRGYLVLAYFKLVLNVVLFCGIIHFLLLMYFIFSRDEILNHTLGWTALCFDAIDIVIGVAVIVGAHKNNQILMEMYYKYSIYVFIILSVLFCFIFHMMYGSICLLLIVIFLFILLILMQVYLNQMVKTEVLMLKSMFKILKNDEDPLCIYINNADD